MRPDGLTPSRWLRPLGQGLLCLVLLVGAMDLHPVREAHPPHAGSGEGFYFPEAAHPGQPVHVESAHAAPRPQHCAACVHRQETRGQGLPRATFAPLAGSAHRLVPTPVPGTASGARRSAGARAPPLS